jgi:sugar transferase (PEP-CTERM system associated)
MIRLFHQYISPRKAVFVLGEGMLIFSAVTLASYLLLPDIFDIRDLLMLAWQKILLVTLITQVSLYFNDLYESQTGGSIVELATRLVQAIGMTSIALAIIYFIWPQAMIGRWIFFGSILFLILFLTSWRLLYAYSIHKKLFTEKAIIIGDGELAKSLFDEIKDRRDIIYDIRLVLGHKNGKHFPSQFNGIPVRYGFEGICDIAEAEGASNIIVALDQKRGIMPFKELLNCKLKGISIIDGESFYERITGKLLVEKINPSWLIFSDGFVKSPTRRIVKRLTGTILSVVMLVLLSPLMFLVAVAIKLDSRGPVIFSQDRVGEDEEVFRLHKFRSMRADAEKESGPVWATENDPRITRVGKIIRKLRIDELPQLWNVLKGDISFVGPRPERPFFVEKLKKRVPYYKERFSVKPGVTGWAQIKYGYGASEQDALEKLKYDLYYIKNMSVVMDLLVMFHTAKIVLLGRGSR